MKVFFKVFTFINREDEMHRACNMHLESRNSHRVLIGKPDRKTQVGRTRRMWEDNIRRNLRERRLVGMDRINLVQDSDQWQTCEHRDEPSGSIKCWEFLD
jgi:hypothetical protein